MGIGIFERLYSEEKIKEYFEALDRLSNSKVFILADEITGCNNFVLAGKKFDRENDKIHLLKYQEKAREKFKPKYEYIKSLIATSKNKKLWRVVYWDFLSKNSEYEMLLATLRDATERFENHYLKKEVLKATIFGFGARLRKNFTASFVDFVFDKHFYRYLETLSEYTVEEVAATLFLARQNWVKAGHEDEIAYDELSGMCFDRFNKEFIHMDNKPEFFYF